jgi:hypothetical protein
MPTRGRPEEIHGRLTEERSVSREALPSLPIDDGSEIDPQFRCDFLERVYHSL